MMKKVCLLLLCVGMLVSLILAGCAKTTPTPTPTPSPTPTPTAGPKEIVWGTNGPLTGMYAGFGRGGVWGLKMAVEDINKQGGILVKEYNKKLPVRLVVLDNESDPNKAGTLTENLILTEKVDFLISAPELPPTIASIGTVAERYKTPYVLYAGPFEPNNAIREAAGKWKYVWESGFGLGAPAPAGDFRNKPGYTMLDDWVVFLNKFGSQTNKKAAIFAADDSDGRGWYATFPKALEQTGIQVFGADKELGMAPLATTDFTSIINQWKDANCDILLGNAPAPWFGVMWRQIHALGYQPKVVIVERGGMFYSDVTAWGGDLPLGIVSLILWAPTIKAPGIGDTTPQSLADRWTKETKEQFDQNIGAGYGQAQILMDAIQRAGTLDKEKVNAALAQTDVMTINHRAKFDETQFNRFPITEGQWFKTNKSYVWEMNVIVSLHDFYPTTAEPLFPIPYK